jgi:diketogulonate reductase-like aldo/keto reductase
MDSITLHNGDRFPILGLGTWRVGGGMSPDRSRDAETIQTLRSAIELGYTHLDTAEMYGGGHTEELIAKAIKDFPRQNLFLTTKVSPSNLRYQDVLNALDASLRRLGTDYVDLYLIHWPNERIPLEETFRALNLLVQQGRVRHLGVSNFDLAQMRRAQALAQTPLATNQVPYSLSSRRYAQNGVLDHCQASGISLTAYSPIKGGVLRRQDVQRIAARHKATTAQVALQWLLRQPGVITIPMSLNIQHLQENLAALDLELTAEDLKSLKQGA